MIARLELRAAALRADGTRAGSTIAACLDDVLARFRAELASCPAPAPSDEPINWASPIFNAGGRFDPFAGEKWQRMLASAATCERLGAHDAAVDFRAAAENIRVGPGAPPADPATLQITPAAPVGRSREKSRGSARPLWTGDNMPPPPPTPFTAGPQLGLFG